jgi:CHAT domain-containing protein
MVAALKVLFCTACATLESASADARLAEAQKALDEGKGLKDAKQYIQAVPKIEHALELREAILGETHLQVAECLDELTDVLQLRGEVEQAELHFQRALAIREAALGKNHPDVVFMIFQRFLQYIHTDSFEYAEPLIQRLLAISEMHRDEDDLWLFRYVISEYARHGLSERQESLIKHALAIQESALGVNDPDIVETLRHLAEFYGLQGLYAQAVPLYERMLAIEQATLGHEHPALIYTITRLADLYEQQEDRVRAKRLYERALAIEEAALRKQAPDLSFILRKLAWEYRSQSYYARAEMLYVRALTIQEAALGTHHPSLAEHLQALAGLYYQQLHYARAEPLYDRALAIQEATLGRYHPGLAQPLRELAALYCRRQLHARAEQLYERALTIQENALGPHHPDLADTLRSLAEFYNDQGLHVRAEQLYERALTIQEAALGGHHPDLAMTLRSLASFHKDQGLYARAEALYERAIAIQERALGRNHPDLAWTLEGLADLYEAQGLHARAEPLYERSLTIQEAGLGKNHLGITTSLLKFANFQGLHARAAQLHERALTIQEAVLGKHHPDLALTLRGFASFYEQQGLHTRAAPLYERALTIQEAALGKHHPDLADSLYALGDFYEGQRLYARAEPFYERALAIQEEAFGKDHPDLAHRLRQRADHYRDQGLHTRAEPLYERVLKIEESSLGNGHPDLAQTLLSIAKLRLAQQRFTDALPLLERAFSISEAHLRQEAFGLSEARLARTLLRLREEEEVLYSLVRAHPENARVRHLALSASLLRKGRSVEEIADTSRLIYRGLSHTDRKTFERLRALRTQLSTLSLAGPGKLSPTDYQQRLKALTSEGDALEAALSRQSASLRNISALPAPLEFHRHVAAALPANDVLVEFVAYRDSLLLPRAGAARSAHERQLRYLALLLFSDGRTHALDLGPAEPIDRAALHLHGALTRASLSTQAAAEELYRLTFRPLLPLLGKKRRLFLAPDGQLTLAPFAALHDGFSFLIDAWDITYLTSGKDLLPRPAGLSPARDVVVLADPDFGVPPAPSADALASLTVAERSAPLERFFSAPRSKLPDQTWVSLPGTRKEAEAIQRLFPHARLFLGHAATKEALLRLETPGLLHIATHGFFLEDAPVPENARAVVQCCIAGSSGPPQRPPDPLLRSGLVLAGAKAPEPSLHSRPLADSLVTALELVGLNLWGTQLVVLSACDTGRGDIKLGQGVFGLRRALVTAGAETLVTSLWKVNDATTQVLMESYYRNLLAGQGRSAALSQAMRALRQKHPHPHFWAPFITIGKDAPLQVLTVMPQAMAAP